MHILIIDDEQHIRKILKDFLTDCGHHVECAANGSIALRHLETTPNIDLIISDICMPEINGEDFLRAVQVRHPGLPTILITGHGTERTATNAFYDGAYGYLKKPVHLTELLNLIERLENQSRLESEYENFSREKTQVAFAFISDNLIKLRDMCNRHPAQPERMGHLIDQIEMRLFEIQDHISATSHVS